MESKTVLLKYQKSRKKVVIPVEKQTSELVYLEAAFRKLFNFEKQVNLIVSFQRFDSDFDEFVDLEDSDELRHLETLNVVVTAVLVTPPQSTTCEEVDDLSSTSATTALLEEKCIDELPHTSKSCVPSELTHDSDSDDAGCFVRQKRRRLDDTYQSDSSAYPSSGSLSADIQTTPTSSVSSLLPCKVTYSGGKKREVVKTEDDSVPLPDPFPLPKYYSREVETALERGQLPRKERRIFLSGIASSMLRFKRYPTRDDYISVCCAICRAYPFLKATSGRPYDPLFQGLVNRFKEFRRDKSKPKAVSTKTTTTQAKGKSPGITKPVVVPQLQAGEDSVSCERHIKQLQVEFSKTRRNPEVVSALMRKTFPLRRAEIIEQPPDLTKLFERFPFLQEIDYGRDFESRNHLNPRLLNTEVEERMFGQCKSITSNQHTNHIVTNILVRMNCEERRRNSTDTVQMQEKEVSKFARCLSPNKNTTIPKEWIENSSVHYQAHLERISDFLLPGPGVWWQYIEDGVEFFYISNPNCQPSTPSLQHFQSIKMGDVDLHPFSIWEKCLEENVQLPASYIRTYTVNGDANNGTETLTTTLNSCAPAGQQSLPPSTLSLTPCAPAGQQSLPPSTLSLTPCAPAGQQSLLPSTLSLTPCAPAGQQSLPPSTLSLTPCAPAGQQSLPPSTLSLTPCAPAGQLSLPPSTLSLTPCAPAGQQSLPPSTLSLIPCAPAGQQSLPPSTLSLTPCAPAGQQSLLPLTLSLTPCAPAGQQPLPLSTLPLTPCTSKQLSSTRLSVVSPFMKPQVLQFDKIQKQIKTMKSRNSLA